MECLEGGNCASLVCKNTLCQVPACNDGVKNGVETGVDCGGPTCTKCAIGQGCGADADCVNAKCLGAVCTAGKDCQQLATIVPKPPTGVYTIDPDGAGVGAAFSAYCDMDTDGGGWTLLATLKSSNFILPKDDPAAWAGAWSDDWWTKKHGTPTDPLVSFSNHDMRAFKPLVNAVTLLRASTPGVALKRFHFGFTQADWDLWNQSRQVQHSMGAQFGTVNVIGPFWLANVLVSGSVNKTDPKLAAFNGSWAEGTFYLGSAPGAGDMAYLPDGLGLRYHVGTNLAGQFGFVANSRVDARWHLWLR
ncbi:MAG: hypothetical protein EXR75_03230 [Myxococcales bacterium]|nr:hypothetical protein [Myxococcales bacterium]